MLLRTMSLGRMPSDLRRPLVVSLLGPHKLMRMMQPMTS
ncbi:hypothetical protein LINPERHAP2_LOCUS42169 [Linum perenne]